MSPKRTKTPAVPPAPAWTDKIGKQDETTFQQAAPATSFFELKASERTGAAVVVNGKIRRGDIAREMLLPLPGVTNDRLKAAVTGAHAPAIVALIEYALDELERQGLTLTARNQD